MAIITENINNNPMVHLVLANSQEAKAVTVPTEGIAIDFCICKYYCEYVNNVFADPLSDDDYRNDKSSWLIGLTSVSSTLEILLVNALTNEETIINDNSLGEYFPKGTWTNQEGQENYVGFIADWKKIQTAKGNGLFYFKFTETVFGNEVVTESIRYRLLPFSDELSRKTIRYRFVQRGVIENGLDYRGIDWVYEIRLQGRLLKQPSLITQTDYLNGDRAVEQIQDGTVKQFQLTTGLIPESVGNLFDRNGVLANSILVTNYDPAAYSKVIDFDLKIREIADFQGNFELNPLGAFIFDAEERIQDNVKRNV